MALLPLGNFRVEADPTGSPASTFALTECELLKCFLIMVELIKIRFSGLHGPAYLEPLFATEPAAMRSRQYEDP